MVIRKDEATLDLSARAVHAVDKCWQQLELVDVWNKSVATEGIDRGPHADSHVLLIILSYILS